MDDTATETRSEISSISTERPNTQSYFNDLVRQRQAAFDLVLNQQSEGGAGIWKKSKGKGIAESDTFLSEQERQLEEAKELQAALDRGELESIRGHVQREIDRLIKEGNEIQREIDVYGDAQILENNRLKLQFKARQAIKKVVNDAMIRGDDSMTGEYVIIVQKDLELAQKALEDHPITPLDRKKGQNQQQYEILRSVEQEIGMSK